MANLPKGTLSEKLQDSEGTMTTTTATKEAVIKVVDPAPKTLLDVPVDPNPVITKEPGLEDSSPSKKEDSSKKPCTICKAQSVASLAFSFSLVILVLAFSFSLVKTKQ